VQPRRRCRRPVVAALVAALVAGVFVTGCGDDGKTTEPGSSPTAASSPTTAGPTTGGPTTGGPSVVTTPAELQGYVGLTVAEAEARADAENRPIRVVEEDGEKKPVTMDLQPNRVNLVVVDGTVTSATLG
jgi:hypothetical protein